MNTMKLIVFAVAIILFAYCGGHPKNPKIQGNVNINVITVVPSFNCKINKLI